MNALLYVELIDKKIRFTIEMKDSENKLKWESFNTDDALNSHIKKNDIKIDEVRVV